MRIGGTLPAAVMFERVLGLKTLLFSFSTADENLHAPNEFFRLERIDEGIAAWSELWRRLSGDDAGMTAQEIVRRADEAGIRLVRFLWCGNDGTVRAKASGRHGLEGRLERGIGVTVAMQAMNGLDQLQPVPAMGPVGEYRLMPALDTFRVLPTRRTPARC